MRTDSSLPRQHQPATVGRKLCEFYFKVVVFSISNAHGEVNSPVRRHPMCMVFEFIALGSIVAHRGMKSFVAAHPVTVPAPKAPRTIKPPHTETPATHHASRGEPALQGLGRYLSIAVSTRGRKMVSSPPSIDSPPRGLA